MEGLVSPFLGRILCSEPILKNMTSSRDEFFQTIRRALGRESGTPDVAPDESTYLSQDAQAVEARVSSVRQLIEANAEELMAELEISASEAGWKVARVKSAYEAARYIKELSRAASSAGE